MTGTREELIAYRIERARETLDDARLLADQERWASCANRLYYACFYAVSALLLRQDLKSTKHSGIRSLFNQHFVKTGEVSKELGRTYNDLYEIRQESDYVDLLYIDGGQVRPRVPQAKIFVEEVAVLASTPASAAQDAGDGKEDEQPGKVAETEDEEQAAKAEDAADEGDAEAGGG